MSSRPSAVLTERLTAQLLAGPPAVGPAAVAQRLLAVQGQDGRGVRLAIRSRSSGLTAADVDRALNHRELVIGWLNRGTLHLVRAEDYGWLHALTAPPQSAGIARRLGQEGVSADAAELGVGVIRSALAGGPMTRAQLGERLERAGVPTRGQALVHLLSLASQRGVIVRGPMIGAHHAFVLVREWLGPAPPFDRDVALAELGRRYLAGHAPADERDLARWSGLPLRDARAAFRLIASELRQRPDGLVDMRARAHAAALPPPRLLGSFDPVLLGWRSREEILGAHQTVVTVNGLFRPFALVDGRAAGRWQVKGSAVVIEPFTPLASGVTAALAAEADDVVRFLGQRG